ncbi:MAG: single-stranded DNA-binding protein [Isosphaeraceae bacterium]|jgi:single-strand DNA-binding protein|nr:MAG: single-stranded DNA-binding protein [Isosphaeraceae bacterium]
MADLNKVFLIGRLTQDPELRYTPNGAPVTDLRIATSRPLGGPNEEGGERREETLYIDVTVWNRQAENCCQYLTKGRAVHVEGYLKMDTWEDRNTGDKRSKIKVVAERVQFLDGRRDNESAPRPEHSTPRAADTNEPRGDQGTSRGTPSPRRASNPPPPPADDDIPF